MASRADRLAGRAAGGGTRSPGGSTPQGIGRRAFHRGSREAGWTGGRDLYTDRLSAARGAEEADLLHRADKIQLNPADAASLGVEDGAEVQVSGNGATLKINAEVSEDIPAGAAWLPILHAQGAAQQFSAAGAAARPKVTVGPA